jgi:hypothetical protein
MKSGATVLINTYIILFEGLECVPGSRELEGGQANWNASHVIQRAHTEEIQQRQTFFQRVQVVPFCLC